MKYYFVLAQKGLALDMPVADVRACFKEAMAAAALALPCPSAKKSKAKCKRLPLEMPRQQEGLNTRTLQDYLGRNIEHTVRYTKLSSSKFKNLWPN